MLNSDRWYVGLKMRILMFYSRQTDKQTDRQADKQIIFI